jgi:hypothetical protein
VADHASGLIIMDLSALPSIGVVATLDTPGFARSVALTGEIAYVPDYDAGLQVIDIADPTVPNVIATLDTPGEAEHILQRR